MEKIEIPVLYYIDDKGNRVCDVEEMTIIFQAKLNELTDCFVICSVDERDSK